MSITRYKLDTLIDDLSQNEVGYLNSAKNPATNITSWFRETGSVERHLYVESTVFSNVEKTEMGKVSTYNRDKNQITLLSGHTVLTETGSFDCYRVQDCSVIGQNVPFIRVGQVLFLTSSLSAISTSDYVYVKTNCSQELNPFDITPENMFRPYGVHFGYDTVVDFTNGQGLRISADQSEFAAVMDVLATEDASYFGMEGTASFSINKYSWNTGSSDYIFFGVRDSNTDKIHGAVLSVTGNVEAGVGIYNRSSAIHALSHADGNTTDWVGTIKEVAVEYTNDGVYLTVDVKVSASVTNGYATHVFTTSQGALHPTEFVVFGGNFVNNFYITLDEVTLED